ncbi:hypothetical protein PanWU01x14_207980 [Parasponia andersonii]|uniref:Uncharacterized protein n=1 Tax=Parasponia andersonii TaxID=3476 RepID=A0A2P5BV74_PARAD|nr:hypothetical protein PanWU01x14_207980 [Parasponia andersonii]
MLHRITLILFISQLRVTSGVLELCCRYEILTGRRPLERNRPRTEQKLVERVKKQFPVDSERFGWPLYPNGFLIDMFNALKKEDFKVFSIVLWSLHNGRNSAQFGNSHRKLEEWNMHDIGRLKTTFGGVDFVEAYEWNFVWALKEEDIVRYFDSNAEEFLVIMEVLLGIVDFRLK